MDQSLQRSLCFGLTADSPDSPASPTTLAADQSVSEPSGEKDDDKAPAGTEAPPAETEQTSSGEVNIWDFKAVTYCV